MDQMNYGRVACSGKDTKHVVPGLERLHQNGYRSVDFRERAPWWGGDLQTLRNQFVSRVRPLQSRSLALEFPTSDGSGDRLVGSLETPITAVTNCPLVVLIHGLTGCQDSDYVREAARFHLIRGRAVLRLNLRGAGPSKRVARGYYHAGCASDIRDVLGGIPEPYARNGIFAVGFSLGGNILLNFLESAERDNRLVGAATVSAPIEPLEACCRLMASRNALYHRWLLKRMKQDVLSSTELSIREREDITRAQSVFEFDDRWVAPRNGFRDARDYYAQTAGARRVPIITIPTLLLHARNDPWIPHQSYLDAEKSAAPQVEIVIARSGGHVGFHEQGHSETWHDRLIDKFLARISGTANQ